MDIDFRKFVEQLNDYIPNRGVNSNVNRGVYVKPEPPKKKAKWETERKAEQTEDKEFVPKGELLSDIQSGILDSISKKYRHTRWDMIDARFERCNVKQLQPILQEIVDNYNKDFERWLEFCDTISSFGGDMEAFKGTIQKRHGRNLKNLEEFALYLVSSKHYKFKDVCWEDFQKKRNKAEIEHKLVVTIRPFEMKFGRTKFEQEIEELDS